MISGEGFEEVQVDKKGLLLPQKFFGENFIFLGVNAKAHHR